jgi:hypothetical protein
MAIRNTVNFHVEDTYHLCEWQEYNEPIEEKKWNNIN